jgi:hypothetical protein
MTSWTAHLPDDERVSLVEAVCRLGEECRDTGETEPVVGVIHAWRAAAEIHSNPRLSMKEWGRTVLAAEDAVHRVSQIEKALRLAAHPSAVDRRHDSEQIHSFLGDPEDTDHKRG